MSKKLKPLTRLQRLLEVKQQDIKISQLRLHKKKSELNKQHERLKKYRQEYVRMLMENNQSPAQMDDTRRFLQHLETSIEDTQKALESQTQSEDALQVVAGTLNSQQKSIMRRMQIELESSQSSADGEAPGSVGKSPYTRGTSTE